MTYKASEIVRKAKNLADISNSDYISYEEDEQYLQTAWKAVYQALINKGDKQFIREARLGSGSGYSGYTEYEIPFDLYQICSINDKMSGREITRHASTESINSGTYDIVNNRIRLYGYSGNNLVLTYWVKPLYLSFPNRPIEIEDLGGKVISTASNSILLDDGTVYNLLTKETIATLTLPEVEDYTAKYYLGNGHVLALFQNAGDYKIKVINFKGNLLTEIDDLVNPVVLYDAYYNLNYAIWNEADTEYVIYNFFGDLVRTTKDHPLMIIDSERTLSTTYDSVLNKNYWIIEADKTELFKVEMTTAEANANYLPFPSPDFDSYKAFFYNGNLYLIRDDNTLWIEELQLPTAKKLLPVKYGIIGTNGNELTLYSGIPDTDLNFPNELLFEVLSADLALSYAMKQNADTGSLDNLYKAYYNRFMDSLSQAGSYTRIKNIYR